MISHTALTGAINPNTYIISTIIFYLRNIQAYSGVIERRLFTRMTIPSCLRAHSFNFCFQNSADSAFVMENNWPILQCWLLLLLLFAQMLICQQPPESGGVELSGILPAAAWLHCHHLWAQNLIFLPSCGAGDPESVLQLWMRCYGGDSSFRLAHH